LKIRRKKVTNKEPEWWGKVDEISRRLVIKGSMGKKHTMAAMDFFALLTGDGAASSIVSGY